MLVATPIGNLGDLSPRATEALLAADVVAAEDTRRTARLMAHAGRSASPLLRYDEHTERERTDDLLDRAVAGQMVVVVTDAGTPGISDPGHVLVRAAARRGVPVELIPGPNAVVHALVLSGLPTDRFVFEGFLPRKATQRRTRIAALVDEPRTIVCYVSPHRAADELAELATALGPRRAALARELTKVHEQVLRMPLHVLAETVARDGVRGELTLVIEGAPTPAPPDEDELVDRVRTLLNAGHSLRDAAATVAADTGAAKRRVYQLALDARGE